MLAHLSADPSALCGPIPRLADVGLGLMMLTGVMSGFGHCAGMCGPFVAAYALPTEAERGGCRRTWLPPLLYNAGRITTYTLLGAGMGLAGSFVKVAAALSGMQRTVSLLAGLAMLLVGLHMAGWLPAWPSARSGHAAGSPPRPGLAQRLAHRLLQRYPGRGRFALGLILGLIPCGIRYAVEVAAALSGSPVTGAALMLAFGVGTLPAMLGVGVLGTALGRRLRGGLQRAASVPMVLAGVLMLARTF